MWLFSKYMGGGAVLLGLVCGGWEVTSQSGGTHSQFLWRLASTIIDGYFFGMTYKWTYTALCWRGQCFAGRDVRAAQVSCFHISLTYFLTFSASVANLHLSYFLQKNKLPECKDTDFLICTFISAPVLQTVAAYFIFAWSRWKPLIILIICAYKALPQINTY